jgi:hypothetical protein
MATGLAPELIAAVLDRESRGGEALKPAGPSGTGDWEAGLPLGHGRGLLQIDDRFHRDWLAQTRPDGTPLWMDAAANILFGAQLLKGYVDMLGSIPAGVCAYNAGPSRAQRVLDTVGEDVEALDSITTGKDYVSDVLRKEAELQPITLEG